MLAIDIESGLTEAWERIATLIPKLLGFLAILIIGYFVAKLVARVVDGLLERIGFDRWVERGALKTALDRSKFDASDILSVVAFWAVFLISLQLAFGVFGPNPVSDLIQGIIAYLPNLFAAVVILVIVAALAKVVTDLLAAALGEVSGGEWIARVAGMAILVIGVFAALNQLQIAPEIVNGLYLRSAGGHRWCCNRCFRWGRDPDRAWILGTCQSARGRESVGDPAKCCPGSRAPTQ
jgi:hypothetical protein